MFISRIIAQQFSSFIKRVNYPISKSIRRNLHFTAIRMDLKEFILENESPFEQLEVSEAFENLSDKERKYLHYYTKVSELCSEVFCENFLSRPYRSRHMRRHLIEEVLKYQTNSIQFASHIQIVYAYIISGKLVRCSDLLCSNIARVAFDLHLTPQNHRCRKCRIIAIFTRRPTRRGGREGNYSRFIVDIDLLNSLSFSSMHVIPTKGASSSG